MANLIESGYGVTSKGFNRPNLADLMDRTEELFKETDAFGEDFSFTVDTVLFQLSGVWLNSLADSLEMLEQVYMNSTPLEAQGNSLYKKGSFIGMPRKQASRAVVEITITGELGTETPAGQLIRTADNIIFSINSGGTITNGNSITLTATALETGLKGNVGANSIVEFVNPIAGATGLTNPKDATGGQEQENEFEFRKRYYERFDESFGANVDGIASALKELSGVRDALCYENDKDIEVDGIPPHSIAPFVWGGSNTDIAKKLFDVKVGGIRSFGNVIEIVTDSQGISHTIGFTRPNEINVYIKLSITKTSDYPIDGDNQVKEATLGYIDGLGLGASVYPYQISSTIANLQIRGINNIEVELSKDGATYVTTPIVIARNEIAVSDDNKVVIQ